MNEVALVNRAAAGDRAAQGELARRSFRRVLAYCQSRVFQLADAEELTQESLLRAMIQLPTLVDPPRFDAWLRGIASHVCTDWHRQRRRDRGGEPADVMASPDADPAEHVANADEQESIQRKLQELPEELREVLLLFYYEEQSYEEIAQWLGVARATVSDRLARARNMLRQRMCELRSYST